MNQYLMLFSPLQSALVPKLLGLVVVDPEEPLRVYAPNFSSSKDMVSQLYEPPITYKGFRSLSEIADNARLLKRLPSFYHEDTTVLRYEMGNIQQNLHFLLSDKSYSSPVRDLIHSQQTSSAYFITGFMVTHRPKELAEPVTSHNFSEVKSTGIPGTSRPSRELIKMNIIDEDIIFAVKYHKLKLKGVSLRIRFSNLFQSSKKDSYIDISEAFLGQTQVGLIVPNGSEATLVKSTLHSNNIAIPPHELKILSHPESSNSAVQGHLRIWSGSLISDLHSQSLSPDDVFIMLVGLTGSGKSKFISTACSGLEEIIGHDLNSCTNEIKVYSLCVEGRNIHLIDTPGFDDTNLSDYDVRCMILAFLADLHQRNLLLSGIIYLQRISDKRLTSSAHASFSMIKSLIGRNDFSFLTLVTTFWDLVRPEDGLSVESQLLDTFFNDIVAKGSRYLRHDGTWLSAIGIIKTIVREGGRFMPGEQENQTIGVPLLDVEMGHKMERLQLANAETLVNESSTQQGKDRKKSTLLDRRVFMLGDIRRAAFIAVMGSTGSGKSNFIQKASGRMNVRVGHGLTSETQRVQFVEFYHEDMPIVLIDTPGFNDTYRSDVDILEEISISLAITYRQNIKLAGVMYVQSILNPRMQGSGIRNIEIFNKLCGEDPLERITFVTSFWDEIELDIGIVREREFKRNFWKGTSYDDSRMYRFFNTSTSAIEVLEIITLENPVVLDIQREVVDRNYEIIQTEAGRFLSEELAALDQEFIEKLAVIKNNFAVAHAEHDNDLQKVLLEQKQWVEKRLAEFHRQQIILKAKQMPKLVDFKRGLDEKLDSLKAEFATKEAARDDLKRKIDKERDDTRRQLQVVSQRANSMMEQLKMITSKNETDRAWYEKRIQELEDRTNTVDRMQLTTWSERLFTTIDMLKGFVDQTDRFFGTSDGIHHQHEYHGLTTQSCEFLRLISCFECDLVPSDLFLRACSQRQRWDSTGEIIKEYPHQTLIPGWLINIFFAVRKPNILPVELQLAHKRGMLDLVQKESVWYYRLSNATKTSERNILTTTDHRNALFNITSILIYGLPHPFTEILWEETLWHCKEVVETTCRPFLSVVNISNLEDYLSQFPIEFKSPYLIQLLYFILDDSFYQNLSIPPFAWQVVQLVKKQSSNADLDLAEVVGIRMLRELFVQSFKAGIPAEKIMLVAKEAYCHNERMTAFVALTIDFLQRSAMSQSAREELADLANVWTPYREDHISTMELISQALISAEFSDSMFRQLRAVDFKLRTATGFALSRRQRFKMARLMLEQCMDEINLVFSRDSHEYAATSVELVQACNILGDFNTGEKWAVQALLKGARSTHPKNPESRPLITLPVAFDLTSKDSAALQISLADTFMGQGRYAEARKLLNSILKSEATSNYITIVCSLRLNKVYRRIGAREELDLHENSPLCKAISLLGNAENALKVECAEELGCTISVLQQRDPKDVTKILPKTIRESYPMKAVLDAHSALLAK